LVRSKRAGSVPSRKEALQVVARRVVERSGVRRLELVFQEIISDEERVDARQATANQRIALLPCQHTQRLERSSVIVAVVPLMLRVVLHHPFRRGTKPGVVLDDNDAWLGLQGIPDPVIVAVDVYAEQIEIAKA